MSFTDKDLKQIASKGLTLNAIKKQIEIFEIGIPFTHISDAATINNGIIALNENLINEYVSIFEAQKNNKTLLKFVPASGAATRMFKFLFQFVNEYNPKEQSLNSYINKNRLKDLSLFMVGLDKFPFYDQVVDLIKSKDIAFKTLPIQEKVWQFAKGMLDVNQLNFGNQPKGLLPFHEYKNNHKYMKISFLKNLNEFKITWRTIQV